jgi:general stress protein 26
MYGVKPETLASRKVVGSDSYIEVSGTAKLCTDEQELHRRHTTGDE